MRCCSPRSWCQSYGRTSPRWEARTGSRREPNRGSGGSGATGTCSSRRRAGCRWTGPTCESVTAASVGERTSGSPCCRRRARMRGSARASSRSSNPTRSGTRTRRCRWRTGPIEVISERLALQDVVHPRHLRREADRTAEARDGCVESAGEAAQHRHGRVKPTRQGAALRFPWSNHPP